MSITATIRDYSNYTYAYIFGLDPKCPSYYTGRYYTWSSREFIEQDLRRLYPGIIINE